MIKRVIPTNNAEAAEMAHYITKILVGTASGFTERKRQFFTWGANSFKPITAEDGSVGLQMKVSGLKHKGLVRIWYEYGPDLFKLELLNGKGTILKKEISEIYLEDLQWFCHSNIETDEDERL